MQSSSVGTTVRVGNHTLSAEELAAGVPPRAPFTDAAGAPADPPAVRLALEEPGGVVRTFGWPTGEAGDSGLLTKESAGRFYTDWTPDVDEDGLWAWFLSGGDAGTTGHTDQDTFFVKRPPMALTAPG